MTRTSELLAYAKARRDLARRARGWALDVTQEADRDRLARYSEDLEEQASALEKQAATVVPISPDLTIGIDPIAPTPGRPPTTDPAQPVPKPKH